MHFKYWWAGKIECALGLAKQFKEDGSKVTTYERVGILKKDADCSPLCPLDQPNNARCISRLFGASNEHGSEQHILIKRTEAWEGDQKEDQDQKTDAHL